MHGVPVNLLIGRKWHEQNVETEQLHNLHVQKASVQNLAKKESIETDTSFKYAR